MRVERTRRLVLHCEGRLDCPLPNLLIPHNLQSFLDIVRTSMVKCAFRMTMTALSNTLPPPGARLTTVYPERRPRAGRVTFSPHHAANQESRTLDASPDAPAQLTSAANSFRSNTCVRKGR